MPRHRFITVELSGIRHQVAAAAPVIARHLAEAEQKLSGFGTTVQVLAADKVVDLGALLSTEEVYTVAPRAKKQARPSQQIPTIMPSSDSAVWWGLQAALAASHLAEHTRILPVVFLHQLESIAVQDAPMPSLPSLRPEEAILCGFLAAGHWVLLKNSDCEGRLQVTCFDGIPGRGMQEVRALSAVLAQCLRLELGPVAETCFGLQQQPAECGALVLAHASFLLQTAEVAFETHRHWAHEFMATFSYLPGLLVGSGALSEQQKKDLEQPLIKIGVPSDQVAARAQAGISKVGEIAKNPLAGPQDVRL